MFNDLPSMLVAWAIIAAAVPLIRSKRSIAGVALVPAFLLNLSMIHWVGAAIHVLPANRSIDHNFTLLGMQQSLYGIIGFSIGAVALSPMILGLRPRATAHMVTQDRYLKLPKAYVAVGVVSYILLSFLGDVASIASIMAAGQELLVVGLALGCWYAWRARDYRRLSMWLLAAFLLPVITVITRGFMGYGVIAMLTVLVFLATLVRSRVKVVFVSLIMTYLGLTVFVNYMRDRKEIRDVVSAGRGYSDRIERVALTIDRFEWFDPSNPRHLDRIEDRLNQNYLVGAAVTYLSSSSDFAHGDTIWAAFLSVIPRALWPDKPVTGGSGGLVTRYTGIRFAEGTSVGIGQVMELYVNFGAAGVFIGFAILGLIVAYIDAIASERLAAGDIPGFVVLFLPGLSFLQVGGSLAEVTGTAIAGFITAAAVNKYLTGRSSMRPRVASAPLGAAGRTV